MRYKIRSNACVLERTFLKQNWSSLITFKSFSLKFSLLSIFISKSLAKQVCGLSGTDSMVF
jgi:hypothetical protein